uniref:Sp185/333 n=1 Tax=Strongylocentrotus purpuratus TaxID=7668 RepID=A1DY88_STRPU|nr:Sp185/333 [Strongylocentrotus purpuratus]
MEVKVTLIVAIVAALAISAHTQRDYNERRGNENGRERGQGRFGGRPGGMQMGGPRQDGGPMGGRRFDGHGFGAPPMGGPRQDGGPMGGRRFDGPGFGTPQMDGRRQMAVRWVVGDSTDLDLVAPDQMVLEGDLSSAKEEDVVMEKKKLMLPNKLVMV